MEENVIPVFITFLSYPKKSTSGSSVQPKSSSGVTNVCRETAVMYICFCAIGEAWAEFESHRGSRYDHLPLQGHGCLRPISRHMETDVRHAHTGDEVHIYWNNILGRTVRCQLKNTDSLAKKNKQALTFLTGQQISSSILTEFVTICFLKLGS